MQLRRYNNMKIIQITTDINGDGLNIDSGIYGLGDDNNIYYWIPREAKWTLWKIK